MMRYLADEMHGFMSQPFGPVFPTLYLMSLFAINLNFPVIDRHSAASSYRQEDNKKPPGNNAPGGSNKERVLANI
jgi:hypothetical protein